MGFASSPSKSFFPDAASSDPASQPLQTTLLRANSTHQPNLVDVAIDPLVAESEHANLRQVRLDILSDTTLCLQPVSNRPPWLARLTYLTFLGCLIFMIYASTQAIVHSVEKGRKDSIIMWCCFAGIPALILIGALIYPLFKAGPLQFKFDRISRLLTVQRCYGFSKTPRLMATFNLDDVVAIQLLFRYFKAVKAGIPMHDLKKKTYEMNLVFRNVSPARVNLAIHSDGNWMRQAGARLGEFLEVAVVDQMG